MILKAFTQGAGGIFTKYELKRRTSGNKINTAGKATNQEKNHADSHIEKKLSTQPIFLIILMSEMRPLIKNDKKNGITIIR